MGCLLAFERVEAVLFLLDDDDLLRELVFLGDFLVMDARGSFPIKRVSSTCLLKDFRVAFQIDLSQAQP